MTINQLPQEAHLPWYVKVHRGHVTRDGTVIYDPRLWWPIELLVMAANAFRTLRYSRRLPPVKIKPPPRARRKVEYMVPIKYRYNRPWRAMEVKR